jgi:hypothetical protein
MLSVRARSVSRKLSRQIDFQVNRMGTHQTVSKQPTDCAPETVRPSRRRPRPESHSCPPSGSRSVPSHSVRSPPASAQHGLLSPPSCHRHKLPWSSADSCKTRSRWTRAREDIFGGGSSDAGAMLWPHRSSWLPGATEANAAQASDRELCGATCNGVWTQAGQAKVAAVGQHGSR